MPEYMIKLVQQCKSCGKSIYEIDGYSQTGLGSERTYPKCTCPAYKYGKRIVKFGERMYPEFCKHIIKARSQGCLWHQCYSKEVQTKEQEKEFICPKCDGETEIVKIAI